MYITQAKCKMSYPMCCSSSSWSTLTSSRYVCSNLWKRNKDKPTHRLVFMSHLYWMNSLTKTNFKNSVDKQQAHFIPKFYLPKNWHKSVIQSTKLRKIRTDLVWHRLKSQCCHCVLHLRSIGKSESVRILFSMQLVSLAFYLSQISCLRRRNQTQLVHSKFMKTGWNLKQNFRACLPAIPSMEAFPAL